MQIEISTRHGQLSNGTRDKIQAKVEKLSRFYDRITAIHVTVDLEKEDNPLVEIRVSAERADDFVGTERAESLWASVDLTVHKLEQQLRRFKEKDTDRRRGARKPSVSLSDAASHDDDETQGASLDEK